MKEKDSGAIKAAKELIKMRLPKADYNAFVFKLKKGHTLMLKSKFTFVDENGSRAQVRYVSDMNSIFVDEQDNSMPVKLNTINLRPSTTITERLLTHYLLIHPKYGKEFTLIDPAGEAEKELQSIDKFDEVWGEVRAQPVETLRGLNILLTPVSVGALASMSIAELKLPLRNLTKKDPEAMQEALKSPIIKPLYMYHIASALDIIRFMPKRGAIIWVDTDKEICKVPINEEPGVFFARMMLTSDFAKVKEMLEDRINK